jgi:DNA-directed RNA polymerase subunit RPC12/RpoP
MKGSPLKHKGKIASNNRPKSVLVEFITTCPKCGGEIELWSKEPETVCLFCDYRVFDKEGTIH